MEFNNPVQCFSGDIGSLAQKKKKRSKCQFVTRLSGKNLTDRLTANPKVLPRQLSGKHARLNIKEVDVAAFFLLTATIMSFIVFLLFDPSVPHFSWLFKVSKCCCCFWSRDSACCHPSHSFFLFNSSSLLSSARHAR